MAARFRAHNDASFPPSFFLPPFCLATIRRNVTSSCMASQFADSISPPGSIVYPFYCSRIVLLFSFAVRQDRGLAVTLARRTSPGTRRHSFSQGAPFSSPLSGCFALCRRSRGWDQKISYSDRVALVPGISFFPPCKAISSHVTHCQLLLPRR